MMMMMMYKKKKQKELTNELSEDKGYLSHACKSFVELIGNTQGRRYE
jgi:hypothetical protein